MLSGCIQGQVQYVGNPNVVYVGDSNCHWARIGFTNLAYVQAGISGDCHRGMWLGAKDSLPNVDTVFLALGLNDALRGVTTEAYESDLQRLIDSTSATVYCVLPLVQEGSVYNIKEYQKSTEKICTNVIDPRDYGVIVGNPDQVHWSITDHYLFVPAITERI